jgi:hypothetical protein
MLFSHSPQLLDQFPQLSVTALSVNWRRRGPRCRRRHPAGPGAGHGSAGPTARRASSPRSPRGGVFSQMGLKPTQYRCASEALLRRFRKDGSLPWIHPLVEVCNPVSLAYAIPIAVADRRGHQVLISSTSVRTTLGASGCDKSKHQRAETKARQPRRE